LVSKAKKGNRQFTKGLQTKKKENPVYKKNQGKEPIHQKYNANENTRRQNPKKKQTIYKNKVKTLCK
jgi:hypothetical protein